MNTISEVEAIRIAVEEVTRLKSNIKPDEPKAIYKQRHMRLGKNRSGWLVIFQLDVPPGFVPDRLYVEVYESNGEVYVPEIL